MAVVVLKVVALIFQRIERLIFHLPPRPATAHEFIDVPRTHPYVRHPTEVLDRVLADLPILHRLKMDSRELIRHRLFRVTCLAPGTCSTEVNGRYWRHDTYTITH